MVTGGKASGVWFWVQTPMDQLTTTGWMLQPVASPPFIQSPMPAQHTIMTHQVPTYDQKLFCTWLLGTPFLIYLPGKQAEQTRAPMQRPL